MKFTGLENKLKNTIKKTKGVLKSIGYSAVIGASVLVGGVKADEYGLEKIKFPIIGYHHETHINDINNKGEAVGYYTLISGRGGDFAITLKKPFLLRDGIFYTLGYLPDDFFGKATGISDDEGDILLREEDKETGEFKESYIYYTFKGGEGNSIPLGFEAFDINNKGHVVGKEHYRFKRSGGTKRIAEDSDDTYIGYSINKYDVFVGVIDTNDEVPYNNIPFIWENGEITHLPIPEHFVGGSAIKINNSNEIIGYATYIPLRKFKLIYKPCIWRNKIYEDLSSYLDKIFDINNKGQIAGAKGSWRNAIILENEIATNLNIYLPEGANEKDDFYRLSYANNINDLGWVSGRGCINRYRTHCDATGSFQKAFLLKPAAKTLTADLNDDGIVNGFDLAELGNQWLEKEDWYGE